MTHPTRRLGARIDHLGKPALPFSAFRAVTPVQHPASVDYLARLSDWQMLGNDTAGDCEAVRWANNRRHITAALTAHETYPGQSAVWQVYQTQNPGFVPGNGPHGYGSDDDQGMDTQTLLEHLHSAGGPDGVKAAFFAKVDHTRPDEVAAAIAIFGGVWVDIAVTEANQEQFDQDVEWDYIPGSPTEGLHAVYGGGYLDDLGRVRFITWAAETGFTDQFWAHQIQQVFVVAWPEHLTTASFQTGVNREALAAAYHVLTGKVLVLPPVNPPTPTPTPTPVPPAQGGQSFPGSSALVDQHVATSAARAHLTVTAWLEHHLETYFDLPPQH